MIPKHFTGPIAFIWSCVLRTFRVKVCCSIHFPPKHCALNLTGLNIFLRPYKQASLCSNLVSAPRSASSPDSACLLLSALLWLKSFRFQIIMLTLLLPGFVAQSESSQRSWLVFGWSKVDATYRRLLTDFSSKLANSLKDTTQLKAGHIWLQNSFIVERW